MAYEINCSVYDVDDFKYKLSENLDSLKRQFDPSGPGGELGEIQSIFEKNLATVEQAVEDSKRKMYEDISLAWIVRDHNDKVIQQLRAKSQQLDGQISNQKETVAAAQKQLGAAERNQTKVDNTRVPSFSNTEEGRAAKERFENNLEKEKNRAANAVRSAEKSVSNAKSGLKNLETSKANVEQMIAQITDNNKKLFDFINKTQAQIVSFESYVTQCKTALDGVKSRLSSLAKDYSNARSKKADLERVADNARGYVVSIGKYLSKAAGSTYSENNKVTVASHNYLTDISRSLDKTKETIDKLNDVIDGIVKKFGDVIQDNVTKTSVQHVKESDEQIDGATQDFPSKAKNFSNAADDLFAYSNL